MKKIDSYDVDTIVGIVLAVLVAVGLMAAIVLATVSHIWGYVCLSTGVFASLALMVYPIIRD